MISTRVHVLADLCPYVCIHPECDCPTTTYKSKHSLQIHEETKHPFGREMADPRQCPFCGEAYSWPAPQHYGRHMEEIAFSVVSKPYENWSFYTDSLSGENSSEVRQDDSLNPFQCRKTYIPSQSSCNVRLASLEKRQEHEDSFHTAKYACSICLQEETFSTRISHDSHMLDRHIINNHSEFKLSGMFIRCPDCHNWMNVGSDSPRRSLQRHLNALHPTGNWFGYFSDLKIYQLWDDTRKEMQCCWFTDQYLDFIN